MICGRKIMALDINLVAPINQLGYGVVGYNILKALDKAGHSVSLWPIGDTKWQGDASFDSLMEKTRKNAELYNSHAPSLRVWHQFELDMFPGSGARIAWPIFELNKFNDRELHHLRSVDHIIVCSQWAADIVKENGVDTPTTVIPLGVDSDLFFFDENEKSNRQYWLKNTTVFINVGKWEKRKGHDELLAAFNAAFSPGDDVELWMINDNPFIGHENIMWKKKYANSTMGPHIKFFPRFESHAQMHKIFSHVDCGVFPSHAEGWNLEIPELMACGAHIIATDYSGHTEYLTADNAFGLEVTDLETAEDGKWFHGQGEWCTFDIAELVDYMREVHYRKQNNTLGVNTAGIETAKSLTWDNSAALLVGAIEKCGVECV